MFHKIAGFVVILTFSLPFVALAQQNSVPIEAETLAAQAVNTVNLDAKVAAEQDAESDINKLLWLGAGLGTFCIAGPICGLAGGLVGNLIAPIDPSTPSGLIPLFGDISDGAVVGCGIGLAVGTLVPLIGVNRYPSDPPAERLLGKSPEYVASYTNTYRSKTRSLRTKWTAVGAAVGCLGSSLLLTP